MRYFVAVALPLVFVACSSERRADLEGLTRHVVADPRISEFRNPHYAFLDPAVKTRGQLLVTLPGTNGDPKRFQTFLAVAARSGFHSVALQYNNAPSLKRLCPTGDPACFDRARAETIYGGGERVDRAHSVEMRLGRLIHYLDESDPNEGWDQYLEDGAPRWDRVVLAGHSQGGSHAGRIARDHAVARVILFGNAPSWIDDNHLTPIASYYGFFHRGDHFEERLEAFERFGVTRFGAPARVEDSAPPYGGSHLLVTERPSRKPHRAVIIDGFVPDVARGEAPLAPAWRYLLGADE